jgi:hypothetical protein
VIGEDRSDAETLKVLICCLLAGRPGLVVRTKGFEGCSDLLQKGARQLQVFAGLGCTKFVVCHDADDRNPAPARERVMRSIVKPAMVGADCCVVIPVQEIEAWILADMSAVAMVFTSWRPQQITANPEFITSPKEYLVKLSRVKHNRPVSTPATDNERVAKHLNLQHVRRRCPSFDHLAKFVTGT